MAPVIAALKATSWADVKVLATGQHRHLLDQALRDFNVIIDDDLDAMRENHSLTGLMGRILSRLDPYLSKEAPDFLLGQGDTTTVVAAAIACFYNRIPFGHVEAGLRTYNLDYPFPEEFNRVVTSLATTLHFAPTEQARANLLKERISDAKIVVTGNTVIDALLLTASQHPLMPYSIEDDVRLILLTAHRRENFGEPMRNIFGAVRELIRRFPDVEFIYPVHPNPNVAKLAYQFFSAEPRVRLCLPLSYPALVAVMQRCAIVVTDSGGLQEEAPALAKPVLVLRTETERPEALAFGVAKLIGTQEQNVVWEVEQLLTNKSAYAKMAKGVSPYGDGHAAERICEALRRRLEL